MDINFNKNEDHNKLLLTDLKQRFAKVKLGGGEKRIEKLHAEGKLTARESKADSVFDKAVADIFENEVDAKNVIKYKEVLSALEMASDKCKSVSNVMEQISVKHS